MREKSLRTRAFQSVRWSAAQTWGGQGISVLVLLVMARLLGPEDFGLFAIGSVMAFLLKAISDQGLADALVQRAELGSDYVHTAFWVTSLAGLSLAALLVAAREPLEAAFQAPGLAAIVPMLAVGQVLHSLNSVPLAMLRRAMNFKTLAVVNILAAALGGLVAVVCALLGYGVWSLVWQHVSSAVVALLLTWLLARWRPHIVFSWAALQQLWRFGKFVFASNLLLQVNRRLDALLIGAFIGVGAVGLYAVGRRLVQMLQKMSVATVMQVAFPAFSRMQDQPERMRVGLQNAAQSLLVLVAPWFVLQAILAEELIIVFLGEKWVDGWPVLAFLSLAFVAGGLQWVNGTVMMACGRSDLRLVMTIVNTVANVLVFFLVYRWGIAAVAAGFAARVYLTSPLSVLFVRKCVPLVIPVYVRALLPPFAGLLFSGVVSYTVKSALTEATPPVIRLLLVPLTGLLTYLICLRLFAPAALSRNREYVAALLARH